jgi:hypothetical protein
LTETSHCQEYDAVPVEGSVPETVKVWSASNAIALTEGAAGAVNALLTVTSAVAEVALSLFASVTL